MLIINKYIQESIFIKTILFQFFISLLTISIYSQDLPTNLASQKELNNNTDFLSLDKNIKYKDYQLDYYPRVYSYRDEERISVSSFDGDLIDWIKFSVCPLIEKKKDRNIVKISGWMMDNSGICPPILLKAEKWFFIEIDQNGNFVNCKVYTKGATLDDKFTGRLYKSLARGKYFPALRSGQSVSSILYYGILPTRD